MNINVSTRVLILLLVANCGLALSSSAQNRPSLSRTHVDGGMYVALRTPLYPDLPNSRTYGITYGQFRYDGMGFRAGVEYTPYIAGVAREVGFPIAFAFRTGARSRAERNKASWDSAVDTYFNSTNPNNFYYDSPQHGERVRSAVGAAIINWFSQIELYAGVTPGYIFSGTNAQLNRIDRGAYWEEKWIEQRQPFSLSLDAGVAFNFNLWRFDIRLVPIFHYYLTDNFGVRTITGGSGIPEKTVTTEPIRWFFTFRGGISFRI